MKTLLIAYLALAVAVPFVAIGGSPATTGALPTDANRIVGAWSNIAKTGACASTLRSTGMQTIVFSAGGTFLDNPRFPPGGVGPAGAVRHRSIGVGSWSYNPNTREYSMDQQFDWYLNGAYDGYQTVHRTIALRSNGNTAAGPVLSIRYDVGGNATTELCGSAVSTRL